MQRYFVDFGQVEDHHVRVKGDDAHHITRVMRMKEGELLIAVLPNGTSSVCSISQILENEVEAEALEWKQEDKEMPVAVSIGSGLPKGDKLEWIIQKGTELGASQFIPFNAARSIVKWDQKKSEKKVQRWERIAKEAAEQSHRTKVPTIHTPIQLKELIEMSKNYSYKWIAYEEEAKTGQPSMFSSYLQTMQPGDQVLVVFGPEGGLSETEVEELSQNGFKPIGLGPRILRTETAPLYVLSAISYHFELLR